MARNRRISEMTPEQQEARREYNRKYREANREKLRAGYRKHNKAYAAKKVADTAAWRRRNPTARAAQQRRRNGALIDGDLTSADWLKVLDDFGHRCAYCGTEGQLTLDHITPVTKGGLHSVGNVAPACSPCNSSKGARDLAAWIDDGRTRGSRSTSHGFILALLP